MHLSWYLNRFKKMSLMEVVKRFKEYVTFTYSRFKYHDAARWPYRRFVVPNMTLLRHRLPSATVDINWNKYFIFDDKFELSQSPKWHVSERSTVNWPMCHTAKINHRPDGSYGDIRKNWELNRLQFLPILVLNHPKLSKSLITDWLEENPYLHGPAYIAPMEVALRWLSIYWAICLYKAPLDKGFLKEITGLGISSGKFIENYLSTHSSAGNHLIIEAVGLFWIGKSFESDPLGKRWKAKGRKILEEQVCRQINKDGTNKEQSFWYLGFILDALFHYFLLEEKKRIPSEVWYRTEKALEFIDDMILSEGVFPDYGDRDDGFVFRLNSNYNEAPFPGLLNIGSFFFNRPEWVRNDRFAHERLGFWSMGKPEETSFKTNRVKREEFTKAPLLKIYKSGGMTLMRHGKGRLLFRHAPLGLSPNYGHGHADALAVLLFWNGTPVLVDLGSGQYNGDQNIRNYFRSTIAHNTVEIGGKNQAEILGPFMWQKSYEVALNEAGKLPHLFAKASHNGYMNEFSNLHTRKITWITPESIEIEDSFSGPGGKMMRGAFHLGSCKKLEKQENSIRAEFDNFNFTFHFPTNLLLNVFFGSENPFMGWRSTVYGRWESIHSIIFSAKLEKDFNYIIKLMITEF